MPQSWSDLGATLARSLVGCWFDLGSTFARSWYRPILRSPQMPNRLSRDARQQHWNHRLMHNELTTRSQWPSLGRLIGARQTQRIVTPDPYLKPDSMPKHAFKWHAVCVCCMFRIVEASLWSLGQRATTHARILVRLMCAWHCVKRT